VNGTFFPDRRPSCRNTPSGADTGPERLIARAESKEQVKGKDGIAEVRPDEDNLDRQAEGELAPDIIGTAAVITEAVYGERLWRRD